MKDMVRDKIKAVHEMLKDRIRFSVYLRFRSFYGITMDRFYKIDTEELASLSSLNLPSDAGEMYEPTPINEFMSIMRAFKINPDDAFLDIGCGKGRLALLAGKFKFKKIFGVDISEQLINIAKRNIEIMKKRLKCKNYEFVVSNAADYKIPSQVTYIYLFNPFPYQVLQKVLINIEKSVKENPRDIIFIYYNPKHANEIEKGHHLEKIRTFEFHHWSLYKSRCFVYKFTA